MLSSWSKGISNNSEMFSKSSAALVQECKLDRVNTNTIALARKTRKQNKTVEGKSAKV